MEEIYKVPVWKTSAAATMQMSVRVIAIDLTHHIKNTPINISSFFSFSTKSGSGKFHTD